MLEEVYTNSLDFYGVIKNEIDKILSLILIY